MASISDTSVSQRWTMTHWLIVIVAIIGFAFDTYELLMLPLVLPPALGQLTDVKPGTPEASFLIGQMFYIPAVAGGIFGLLGGYLTDRFGRRRVLTWSILLYALSAFAAGFSTSFLMLLILRCTTFIGVCVEFVAAVAWLAELFPEPKQRERVLGYTQAFSSFGGLLVAIAYGLAFRFASDLPAVVMPNFATRWLGSIDQTHQHEAWRYTLMSGLIPAIPLILIRPFLPESPAWLHKKAEGTLKRPHISELFAPAFFRTTVVTTLMVACSYGVAFGAIQQITQIVPGMADVQNDAKELPKPEQTKFVQKVAGEYTKMQEVGGLVGRFLLAWLAVRIVSRRRLLWIFQIPALFMVPLVFAYFLNVENQTYFVLDLSKLFLGRFPVTTVSLGVFLAGLLTVAQFSFWGNYLPRVYPVYLRGTGESFAANIGGRMVGASFAWVTHALATMPFIPGKPGPEKISRAAAVVALAAIIVGFISSFFLPEPKETTLEE